MAGGLKKKTRRQLLREDLKLTCRGETEPKNL